MKKSHSLFLVFLILFCHSAGYSQKFTSGIYTGVNFSDIHGQELGAKWSSKPGPSEGLTLGYQLTKSIGLKTGFGYSTVYYEKKYPSYPGTVYPQEYLSLYPNYYRQGSFNIDVSSLRIPLLLTLSVQSEVRFTMQAGVFFSFVQAHSLNESYYSSSMDNNIRKNDFGYIFSSELSYPINDKIEACFNISYLTGKKHFLENYSYRHGLSEFTAGLAYNFILKGRTNHDQKVSVDSAAKKVTVTYRGGVNYSWNSFKTDLQNYSSIIGPSVGFDLNVPMGKGFYFITGVAFERKGYSMKDSSSSFYRYLKNYGQFYSVNSKVLIDYAVIPLLISFPLSKSQNVFFNTGPWIGLRLNARNTGVAYSETRSETYYTYSKTVVYDDVERIITNRDIGWLFSGGVSLPLAEKYKLMLALQYSIGFNDVYNRNAANEQLVTPLEDLKIKNKTISFLIGITLPSANAK